MLIEVPEYKESKEVKLDKEEINYLESKFFNPTNSRNIEYTKDNKIRNNGPWVGVIKLANKEIHFCTKIGANFFYMLSYLNDIDAYHYDHIRLIELERGKLFFDVIAKILVKEFYQILKKSLLKKYVVWEENIKFLKGKLLIKEQIKRNIGKTDFYCQYDNLTFDNLENQSILYATFLLIKRVKNQKLKFELCKIQNMLSNEISLNQIHPEKLLNINYSRINNYYQKILKLSYHIIKSVYAQDVSSNKGIGFNFIVDMNKVYESFLTAMLKEVIYEEFDNFELIPQSKIKSLVSEGKTFDVKPDILINFKGGKPLLVIDIKYKVDKIPHSDFYQVVAYSLALPEVEKAVLLYESVSDVDSYSKVPRDVMKNSGTITIEYQQANLAKIIEDGQFNTLQEFTDSVKKSLKEGKLIKYLERISKK